MLWFFLTLGAAVLWGVGNAISEKFLHAGVSPGLFLFICNVISLPFYFAYSHYTGSLGASIKFFQDSKLDTALLIAVSLLFVAANLMIFISVQLKNATLVSLIEITYPIFTILFTWLILQKFHMNLYTMIGGALIFSGIVLIFLKQPQ